MSAVDRDSKPKEMEEKDPVDDVNEREGGNHLTRMRAFVEDREYQKEAEEIYTKEEEELQHLT
jgi:hypothetical protein